MIINKWKIFVLINLAITAYLFAGYISSKSIELEIKLEKNMEYEVKIFRLMHSDLEIDLIFKGNRNRKELGEWSSPIENKDTNQLIFKNPGSLVRISAGISSDKNRLYEAGPADGFGDDTVTRSMSTKYGVWNFSRPHSSSLALDPGINFIKLRIEDVEEPLIGETVSMIIVPPLGFKITSREWQFLWFWFLWPVIVPVQMLWLIILLLIKRRSKCA